MPIGDLFLWKLFFFLFLYASRKRTYTARVTRQSTPIATAICCHLLLPQRQEASEPLLALACHFDWRLAWNFVNSFSFCLAVLEATRTLCRSVGSKSWTLTSSEKLRECTSEVFPYFGRCDDGGSVDSPPFAMCNIRGIIGLCNIYHAHVNLSVTRGLVHAHRYWSIN